ALDERRPPLMLSPEWRENDDTHRAARRLEESDFPALPAKVGIAVDAGPTPLLGDAAADFRIERDDTGALLVRCEGRAMGTRVESAEAAADLVVKLCRWFMESGGGQARRMGRHRAPLPAWARQDAAPTAPCQALALGAHPLGAVVGLSLGRVEAASLRALVTPFEDCRLRVTPWRRLLVTGADAGRLPALFGVITEPGDPRLSMDACPGAPFCEQASVDTRAMAARLARHQASSLHVSGCAKGCARSRPAAVCLTGRGGRFDVLINDRADGEPAARGLTEPDVLDYLEKLGALHL
ncbi:cobalamin biosynthesis protein CobG, partial [Halomonas sp. 707D7]